MQRIDTSTAVADKWGAGKHGFTDDPLEGPATQLSAAWHDAVQEELAQAIEDQSIALNPGVPNQLTLALNSWQWSGSPSIKSGAVLFVLTGGSIVAQSGSSIVVQPGATFQSKGTCTFYGLAGVPAITALGDTGSASAGVSASGEGVGPGIISVGGVSAPGIEASSISLLPAVRASSNPAQPASVAVEGLAQHVDATAIIGRAVANASTLAAGVKGIGAKDAPGLWGVGVDAPAGLFVGDLTAPMSAALRCPPQDADPTTPQLGDLFFNGTRQAWRIYVTALYKSLHASAKGLIREWGAAESGTVLSGGATLDLSTVTINPEEVGMVLVTVTGTIDHSTDIASAKVFLRDITAGVTINGGGTGWTERALDIDSAATSGRDRSFIARAVYTLPNAASRSFGFQLSALAGDVDYTEAILTVDGVL